MGGALNDVWRVRRGREHQFRVLADFTHMVAAPLATTRLYQQIVGFLAEGLRN